VKTKLQAHPLYNSSTDDPTAGQGKWCFAGDKGYYIGAYEAGQRTRGRLVRGQDHEYEYDGE
jgi:hypothetical protein